MALARQAVLQPAIECCGRLMLCGALLWGLPGTAEAQRQVGPPCDPNATEQTVSFVHMADLHARFGESFAHKWPRLVRYYEDLLAQNPYTLFTNGGDDYEKGSVAELLSQGAAVREAIFATGFDVRVIGNHDYAWGEQELLAFSRDPKSIVLASNTVYTGNDPGGFGAVDFGWLQVGCVKVGFFGMTSKPWDEFNTQYAGDFLPNFVQRWDWTTRAREIVAAHRSSVDLLVMVSHLGFGTDQAVAKYAPHPANKKISAIDLILGGHNHKGYRFTIMKNTPIVQSEFYADGLSRFDITWDIQNGRVASRSSVPLNVDVTSLTATNQALQDTLQGIVDKYAPDAERELAVLELGRDYVELAEIAGRAGMSLFGADAALIDPELTWVWGFDPGSVTQQMLNNLYRVERQPSNTPGFNGLYIATVSGAHLLDMKAAQPTWLYVGPASPVSNASYEVILHKAPALNPTSFFPSGTTLSGVAFMSETWAALDQYARARTASCLYLDTDRTLPSCLPDTTSTVWNFDNAAQPFASDGGSATMAYRDTAGSGWGPLRTTFARTDTLGVPDLPDGASGVMAFPETDPNEGYAITHNFPPNGAFQTSGMVSNYTLVMDVLWPAGSDGVWRALLQTDLTNDSDADWFVNPGNGIGIDGQYSGNLQAGVWYRIATVVNSAPSGGSQQFYVNGSHAGTIGYAEQRHALDSQSLVFTDNWYETAPGYLNAMLHSDRAFTSAEIAALGGPSVVMALPGSNQMQAMAAATTSTLSVRKPQATRVKGGGRDFEKTHLHKGESEGPIKDGGLGPVAR